MSYADQTGIDPSPMKFKILFLIVGETTKVGGGKEERHSLDREKGQEVWNFSRRGEKRFRRERKHSKALPQAYLLLRWGNLP